LHKWEKYKYETIFHQVFPYFWGNIRNLKKEITEWNMFCAMGVNDLCILLWGWVLNIVGTDTAHSAPPNADSSWKGYAEWRGRKNSAK
jgi:hypothetical protein